MTPEDAHLHSELEERLGFETLLAAYIEMSLEPPDVEICDLDPVGGMEFLVAAIGAARG